LRACGKYRADDKKFDLKFHPIFLSHEKKVWYNTIIMNYRRRRVWAEQAPAEAAILPEAGIVPDVPEAAIV
jgi:hypothetical protein